ncbi:MAG: glucose-6-phosphate dehydrogenase [Acidobacteria bacterium]|nr:MAG: glucose-6-phosphate dehydrogenase [Acidobacteriota bacterium]MCE7960248.1 glucose-6-phosphate dehydrogenase [Acidobacteria bacterium ACB2]
MSGAPPAGPATIVVFGGSGDLSRRKLVPALFELHRDRQLAPATAVVGFGRSGGTDEEYRAAMKAAVGEFARKKPVEDADWDGFAARLFFFRGDHARADSFAALGERLAAIEKERGLPGNRLFYLAIPPSGIGPTVKHLGEAGLVAPVEGGPWSRLVVEKPFGHDLASARALNEEIGHVFRERQVFRIDHYLGKETTQNILVFRLGNGLFEPLWNRRYVDHVQITVAEAIGVEGRGRFFEETGVFRDVVQNHVLQLLCLVAMEPPVAFEPNAVRDEKVKVLRALRPQTPEEVLRDTVRGQYAPGAVDGKPVPGYRQEPNVAPASLRETYAAWKVHVDNWRWAGVPFYLRAGKRLPKRVTEIAITFKTPPIAFFRRAGVLSQEPNVLVLRIQPDEGIALRFGAKLPGASMRIEPVKMDFRYSEFFGAASPEAYERLVMDALNGDGTLFARRDEVEAAWEHVTAVLDTWREHPPQDHPNYEAGTWGPEAAVALLARDGRRWRRP